MKLNMYIFLIVVMLIGGGCETFMPPKERLSHREIKQLAQDVDVSDGVVEREAILLAQKFLIDKELDARIYSMEPIEVDMRMYWLDDEGNERKVVYPPSPTFKPHMYKIWTILFKDAENTYLGGIYPVIPFFVDVNAENGGIMDWGLKKDDRPAGL